jgi:hypothetical protein
VEGYEHAAKGFERDSDPHEELADLLERRAQGASAERAEALRKRAEDHRGQAAAEERGHREEEREPHRAVDRLPT